MSNELTKRADTISLPEVKAQIQAIQQAMKAIMKRGTHYDTIPGTGKPSLLKPGSEVILTMFRIGVDLKVEDLSTDAERRFRVTCRGFHIPTGNTVGYGVGEASTAEKKYAWREAVCDEEFEATPETHRQIYYAKGRDGKSVRKVQQIRTNPSDSANTVLKMAKKRAQIDLCLTATACSDIFAQDLEDMDEAPRTGFQEPQAKTAPAPEPAAQQESQPTRTGKTISEAQAKRLYAIVKGSGQDIEEVRLRVADQFGFTSSKEITMDLYDEVISFIQGGCKC